MVAFIRYILLIATLSIGISASAMAQPVDTGNNKKQQTETTAAAATPKKATASDKNAAPPPSEKKDWAVRIKQGEKWYQLSLEFNF